MGAGTLARKDGKQFTEMTSVLKRGQDKEYSRQVSGTSMLKGV